MDQTINDPFQPDSAPATPSLSRAPRATSIVDPFAPAPAAPAQPLAQTGVSGFLKRQLGGQGEQPYGSGVGYLVDNPVTRGLGGAANELATGASELVQRGVGVVSPTAAAYLKRNVTQPLAERQADFEAPKDAGVGSDVVQGISNLGGQLAFAGLAGGGSVAAEAPEAAGGIAKLAPRLAPYLRPAALRAAGALGFGNAAAQAAQQEAAGQAPESNLALIGKGAAMTAANMVPLGGKGGVLTRAVKGAAASEGINEGLNLINGQPLGTGALMATGLGAGFGLFPHAPPGTLTDAANTLHRTAGPAPEQPAAAAPATEAGTAAEPVAPAPQTLKQAPPTPPWINPETGEQRAASPAEIVAAMHGLLDQKAAQAQNGINLMFAPRAIADTWGLPLEQVKSLSKVAANERRAGMTTEQAQARATAPAAPAADETAIAKPANPDVVGNDTGTGSAIDTADVQSSTPGVSTADTAAVPASAQPDLLTNPKAEVSDRQKARIAQRVRGGGVAPGLLDAAAEEATAGQAQSGTERSQSNVPNTSQTEAAPPQTPQPESPSVNAHLEPQSETPPQGGVSASTTPNEEPNHEMEQPAQRSAPQNESGATARAGEQGALEAGTAPTEAAGHDGGEPGAPGTGRDEGTDLPADTAGLENALSKTDRATGPDGATYMVKQNANGEGYHFNRLEDGSSTQHRNDNPAQPWTREQAISAAAQMARERAGASVAPAVAAGDAATAAAKPSAPESAQAGQAATEGQVAQASEAPKASNAAETTPKSVETQAEPAPAQQTDAKQAPFRVEPLGTAGLLVHGDKDAVRAKLAEAGFKKRGTPQKGALRFDARDRDAIEIALGTRAQGIPGTARDFWREQVSRGEKPQPVFAVLDAAGNWHGWSTSEAGAGREMAKLGNRGELLIRKQTAPKDIAPKPENSHASRTPGVEPVRRVGAPAAGADHGADAVRDEAGTATPITDIGEKIGGARKDTAVKTGPLPKRATVEDTRPAWAKRYEIGQIVRSSKEGEEGRWAIHDVRVKDWRGQPKLATRETFATKEEAEHALPLLELARNHGVSYRGEGNHGIYRKVTDRKRVILKDGFATPEDAKRYMAQHAQDLIETKTSVGEEALPKPETVRREGTARREGDVKPQQFRDTFGFRGVEFGNWNNQAERQEVMNHAFDGLHDLAEVLNIPPKAISLNGELGLAFGARGQGLSGARAHYERDRVVMNLTKMRGAGALAHEWFHALDHYLARESGATSKQWVTKADGTRVLKITGDNARDFASYGAGRPSALREELRAAYDTLINTMQRTATTFVRDTTKLETFVGRSRTELENKLAQLRRVLEKPSDYGAKNKRAAAGAEQLAEVDAISRRLINGENLELKMEPNKAAPGRRLSSSYRQTNDDLERLSAILKSVRGYSGFRADGVGIMHDIANAMKHYRVRLLEAADARTHPEAQTTKPTSFRMEAVKADQGRGTNYWSTHHEMAARAFSAYVEDKLAQQGHSSDFLSYGSDERFRLLIPELPRPFPGGEERAAIDKAFDTFFATVRHEETPEGNVRLFSKADNGEPEQKQTDTPQTGRSASGGIPRDRVQQIVSAQTAKWGENQPKVRVLAGAEGLPASAKRDPGYKTAEGYYDPATGTAYVIASNLRSEARVGEVLAHEAIGHHGVEHIVDEAFGTGAWQKIEDSVTRLEGNADASAKVKDVLAETRRRYPDADARTFAKEFLAVSAEKGVRTGLVDRVVAAIRRYLRKIMPNLKISEADLRQTLARAQDYVRSSERYSDRVARMQAMAFSHQPDTFYSALAESVGRAEGAPKKGTAEQWKQWLDGAQRRGEFKGAEREWMGVDQWLDAHKGEPITRADVQRFARDNQVRLQEVVHGDEPPSNAADIHENEDGSFDLTDEGGALADTPDRPTKFGQYTLPGGKNYRELLLTLPQHDALSGDERAELSRLTARKQQHQLGRSGVEALSADESKRLGELQDRAISGNLQPYRSGHFDEPNILAHVRFNDRIGPDGEKILHVEEVQSDWHQAGRKRGYDNEQSAPVVTDKTATQALVDGRWMHRRIFEESGVDFDSLKIGDRVPQFVDKGSVVPDAPFKKEWPMLAMKRVLRYAAEHGYDKVTWTTGEQQAARYDLSKQVKSVKVVPVGADGKYHFVATTNDGHPVSETDPAGVTASDLASHIGKELADRAVNDIANGKKAEYSGLELKLGGEGMRAFYDKLLPNELNKYVKQWGAKVGDATIELPLLKGEGDDSNFVAQRVGGDRGFGVRDVYTDQFVAKDLPSMAAAEAEAAARNKVDTRSQALTVHGVEITPAMREGVMHGQPMFSRPAQATMDDLDKVMGAPDPDRSVFEKAKAWLGGKGEDLRPAALGVLQTRHVLELMEHVEPLKGYGKAYGRSMQQLDTDRSHLLIGEPELPDHPRDPKNMLAKGAVPIAQALRDFTYKKGPAGWLGRRTAEGKALFDMMHQATIQGMDPDKEYERLTIENAHGDAIPWTKEAVSQRLKLLREQALQRGGDPAMREKITEEKKYLRNIAKMERTREQRWPELVRQWQALPEAAKDLYRQTRDWYAQHRDAVEQALVKNIEGYDVPETYRRSLINRMRLQFEEARRSGVYFPLNRDGDYWIAFQDAKGNEGFKMFESESAAAAAEQKLKRSGYQINASGRRDQNARAKSAPPGTFVREVIDILKKAGVSEKTQDAIYQSFLQTLPELSMRKHSIHRRNIAGFSEDGLRAFAKNSFHGAHQLAKLRHLQDMQTTLEAMQQTVDAWRKGGDEMNEGQGRSIGDTAKADALVGELGKRHQWILNPTDAQLANHANALGFVWYLGASPASALTNMTQVVQTVLPVLGAQHGWPKATRMLGAAWRDAARTGGHMDRTLTDPDERRAFLVMQQRGDFSKTQAHTLAGLAEGNVLKSSPAWTKTMNAVSWMFHTAEVINREATGMAAFRLARARGDDFNKAIEYAGEINAGTNFDYSAANRPRLMQGNAMRIALQFKQYGVGMTWLFYRNLYQAMKGETPEVRRVARRTVTGILGMTALLAGTTGLPIYNGVKAAANVANLAFGDPDQPFDFDTEFHAWLAEHMGNEAANVIATGPVSELTGADFANRTSMSNLFFQNNDQNLEGADAYHALLESLAGPMGGITKNFYVGAQRIREGNVQRGIETMLPTAVKNSVKALRFAHDGANTLRGDPILPDISGPQDFIQALGFRPTKLAQQEQVNSALVNFTKAVQERRQTLLNAYAMALHAGDPGDRTAVMEKIRAFNQQYPTIAVTPKTLRASLRSRARYSSQAVNGVAISPKLAMQAREFAGTQSQ